MDMAAKQHYIELGKACTEPVEVNEYFDNPLAGSGHGSVPTKRAWTTLS